MEIRLVAARRRGQMEPQALKPWAAGHYDFSAAS